MLCNNWNRLIRYVESVWVFLCVYISSSMTSGKTCHLCGARTSWESEGKAESAEIMLFGMRAKLDSLSCFLAVRWVCIYIFGLWMHILLHNSETFVSVHDCYFLLQLHGYIWLSSKDIKDCRSCSDISPFYSCYFGPGSLELWSTCVTWSKWCSV